MLPSPADPSYLTPDLTSYSFFMKKRKEKHHFGKPVGSTYWVGNTQTLDPTCPSVYLPEKYGHLLHQKACTRMSILILFVTIKNKKPAKWPLTTGVSKAHPCNGILHCSGRGPCLATKAWTVSKIQCSTKEARLKKKKRHALWFHLWNSKARS